MDPQVSAGSFPTTWDQNFWKNLKMVTCKWWLLNTSNYTDLTILWDLTVKMPAPWGKALRFRQLNVISWRDLPWGLGLSHTEIQNRIEGNARLTAKYWMHAKGALDIPHICTKPLEMHVTPLFMDGSERKDRISTQTTEPANEAEAQICPNVISLTLSASKSYITS